jgi:membrane protein
MPAGPDGGTATGVAAAPGSSAAAPHRIPVRGWRFVLRRTGRRIMVDRLPLLSAGIAFFALLSIAPVLLVALSVYGAVTTPEQAAEQLSGVADVLPPQLELVVGDQLTSITAASAQVLTVRGLAGLLVALWTATAAMTYLLDALTLAYHEEETRSLARRTGLAFAFVLGGALLLGALIAVVGILARAGVAAPYGVVAVGAPLTWAGLAVLMVLVLSVLYRFAPDRKQARWRWVSGGAVVATGLWVATSVGLFAYVQSLGTYETTYGSLAGVVISMFWLFVTVLLVLMGAVVNAEAECQTAQDSTIGPERPLGERGAVVADSAPPYPGEE